MSPGKNDTLTPYYPWPHHNRSHSSGKVAPDKGYREIEDVFKGRGRGGTASRIWHIARITQAGKKWENFLLFIGGNYHLWGSCHAPRCTNLGTFKVFFNIYKSHHLSFSRMQKSGRLNIFSKLALLENNKAGIELRLCGMHSPPPSTATTFFNTARR